MKAKAICKKCGGKVIIDTSVVLTSMPPKYNGECQDCKHKDCYEQHEISYIFEKEEDGLYTGINKPVGINTVPSAYHIQQYECNHMIDVKAVSGGYVTYCIKCGKIFDTKQCSFNSQFTCSSS